VTAHRRERQAEYNEEHGITPQSVKRAVQESLHDYLKESREAEKINSALVAEDDTIYNAVEVIREMEAEMQEAATKLEFEKAAHLRDQVKQLKERAGMKV
jgi:excinuclease ABC subunit B